MVKTDTAIGHAHTMENVRQKAGERPAEAKSRAFPGDVVEISEECKKRLIMGNLKAALSTADGIKGRYNR